MSRIILSPLHYLAIAALALPLLGVGYIAGNGDLLAVYRMHIELSLSGPGSDYDGKIPDASQPIFPIIAEANDLFDVKGKGPRADLLYQKRVASNIDYAERRRRAEVAIENGDTVEENNEQVVAITNIYPSKQAVNRKGKSHRHEDKAGEVVSRQFAGRSLGPDPVGLLTQGRVSAGLPVIDQASVANVLPDHKTTLNFGVKGSPKHILAPGRKVYDDHEKPGFTGLEVKHVASIGSGKRKFFGGLTENEFRYRENRCLATAIYFEARSEPVKGQIAVAQVIMNRVRSRYYADTVCGVVYEGAHKRNACQFSFACDGLADKPKDKKRWKIAEKLAKQVTDGKIWLSDIGHASHYHANYVSPKWRHSMKRIKRIGAHIFYRAKFFMQPTEVAIR